MILATYVVYQALGPRKHSILYTKEEKNAWDNIIKTQLGSWFTIASIFGTITSLATVYVFFLGNSRLFGAATFVTVATIWAGGYVTNYFTKSIASSGRFSQLLAANDAAASVLPSVIWDNNTRARRCSEIVKYVALTQIACVIWLEFSVFSDLAGSLVGYDSVLANTILMLFVVFLVTLFTLKYGLRGFISADLFHVPLLVVSTVALLAGSLFIVLVKAPEHSVHLSQVLTPLLPVWACVAFSVATVFLNGCFQLVTQPHWLRLWIFREKETKFQKMALSVTACVWSTLIIIGLITSYLAAGRFSAGADASDVVVFLLGNLFEVSPVFSIVFWVAGMSALFSASDVQLYSFLLIRKFDPQTGQLNEQSIHGVNAVVSAGITAAVLGIIYYLVRLANLPFEKLVFLLLPICMNVLPSLVRAFAGKQQEPKFLWGSLILYGVVSVVGLLAPANGFFFTVSAPLAPVAVSVWAYFAKDERG